MLRRFWAKVDKYEADLCWLWKGSLDSCGYGRFRFSGRLMGAHQVALILAGREKINDTDEIDHLCRVRNCVNPTHLEYISHRLNVLRGVSRAAWNATKEKCPRWHPYDAMEKGRRRCSICRKKQVSAASLRFYYRRKNVKA